MFRIAIAQINTIVGDLEGNAGKIMDSIREAEGRGTRFIVFPELAVTGYPPEDLLLKPLFITENLKQLKAIAENTGDIFALVGFADREDERIYNAAAVIHKGKVLAVTRKVLLPNYSVFDEKRYFEAADRTAVFELDGLRFGITICEDIWRPRCPAINQCVTGGAHLLFNLSASPYFSGKRLEREALLGRVARENGVDVVYANLVGGQDELLFDGNSLVFNEKGDLVASASPFQEEILYVDLEGRRGKNASGRKDWEMPGLAVDEVRLPGRIESSPGPALPAPRTPPLERLEEIYRALVFGVREYVTKNRFQKVVIGLSGGIDSALVAVLAVEALGAENVIGVTMPSVFSSEGSVTDSEHLARNLGIRFLTLPIAPLMESFDASLMDLFKDTKPGLAEENLQARVRGTLLMTLSNKFGWLVLTTGNKSETSVGYCTLYGDMAGGYAVIKDVYKTLVYELADWINRHKGREVIPRAVIEKEPSAELRPGQRDVDSLPPYEILDPILVRYVEQYKALHEIADEGFDRDTVKRVIALVDSNEYKRRQAPPGIKITPHAFGKDRRLPIVNWYRAK